MTVDELLVRALEPILPVQASDYELTDEGDEAEYITFNYTTNPDDFGDDDPEHEIYSVQVHLFMPSGMPSLEKRARIKKALIRAGFTHPRTTDATDADGQHHIFECQIAEGV